MNSNEDMEKRTTGQEKTDKDVLVKPIEVADSIFRLWVRVRPL